MLNDILILALSLWGLISLLFTFVFKMLVWRMGKLIVTIPLYESNKEILNEIFCIRSFFEFCGLEKRCTVVLINYDAPDWFCNEIINFYEKYDFVKITSPEALTDTIKELRT